MRCTICQRRIDRNTSGLCGPHYAALSSVALDERNKAILAARRAGEPIADVAARFGTSAEVVQSVTRAELYEAPSHRVADLATAVCQHLNVSRSELVGPRRFRHLVQARQAVALLALRAGHSSNVVGRILKRDHSTILHSRDAAKERARRNPDYAALLLTAWEAGSNTGRSASQLEVGK